MIITSLFARLNYGSHNLFSISKLVNIVLLLLLLLLVFLFLVVLVAVDEIAESSFSPLYDMIERPQFSETMFA